MPFCTGIEQETTGFGEPFTSTKQALQLPAIAKDS
jgi:hypothetical protein